MWTKSATRKELAEVLSSGRLPSRNGLHESEPSLSVLTGWDEIELLWNEDPTRDRRPPAAIIAERREQRELLAWLSTYAPWVRPVTAYSRISDRQTAAELLAVKPSPRLGRLEDACLGVIVGETATYVGKKKELRNVTHRACLSTLSFSIARAAGFGFNKGLISEIEEKWSRSRTLVGGSPLPIEASSLQVVWSVIRHLSGGEFSLPLSEPVPPLILDACSQILQNGAVGEPEWLAMTRAIPGLAPLREVLKGPREDRLSLFEHLVEGASESTAARNPSTEFLCAYVASSISPGTLDHLHALFPYLNTFPTLLIWYGLCAGLSSRAGLGPALNGLVRRVSRELVREEHFLQNPTSDIGFNELELMSTSAREWGDLRTSAPGQIVVELLPLINSHYRSPRLEGTDAPSGEIEPALSELASLLDRTRESITRFRRAAGLTQSTSWDADSDKKRKSRR